MKTFTAVVHQEGEWFVAQCPQVGTASQGKTREVAIKNLKEATELYLSEFPLEDQSPSWVTTFDVTYA